MVSDRDPFAYLGMTVAPGELIDAVDNLWRTSARDTRRAPELLILSAVCRALYPVEAEGMALDVALHHALQRLGLDERTPGPAPAGVALALHRAFVASDATRRHFCPLDRAGDIPDLAFGPNAVRRFSEVELTAIIASLPLDPHFKARFDAKRLCQFQWLVVDEGYALPRQVAARYIPFLFSTWNAELGSIAPHPPSFAGPVEAAVCFLLSAPWENLVRDSRLDWRAFQIPWVMTLDDDLFAPSIPVPDPDTLSWIPVYLNDANGDFADEIEIPDCNDLVEDAAHALRDVNDETWERFVLARATPTMAGPIMHFFVRAFASREIDEFLFHITTVEACLGQSSDHRKGMKALPDGSNGATGRTAWRLSTLLEDCSAGPEFKSLFKERSRFVHGESMKAITAESRCLARALARRCVRGVIQHAPTTSREEFLSALVERRP